MSFTVSPVGTTIKEGDLVLVWISRGNIKLIRPKVGEVLQTRYGAFPHESMIGQTFGNQIPSKSNTGFVHLLAPSPELWSLSLPHRTQIVYTPDSSYIVQRLKIRPGSKVIESGTGSGSFTHAIARTVGSRGHIYTYEFHELRHVEASKEIADHGLADFVTVTHRDVCNEGFEIDNVHPNATSVFLDLPSPWVAIPHLDKVVCKDRTVNICCFSPCIEQVTKTVDALKKAGFQHIEMVEVQAKRWEGRKEMTKAIDDAVLRLRDIRTRRNEGLKRRNERLDAERQANKESAENRGTKRENENDDESESAAETPKQAKQAGYNPFGKGKSVKEGDPNFNWHNITRVESEIKSHTSYLTFAVLPPQLSQ